MESAARSANVSVWLKDSSSAPVRLGVPARVIHLPIYSVQLSVLRAANAPLVRWLTQLKMRVSLKMSALLMVRFMQITC